jgi:hypothetical protein
MWTVPKIYENFIGGKPILSPERILHKDSYCMGSVEKKIFGRGLKGPDAKTKLQNASRKVTL